MATPNELGALREDEYDPAEMRKWLEVESWQVRLAADRRISEARAIVEAYENNELSGKAANERLREHEKKWGEASQDHDVAAEVFEAAVAKVFPSVPGHSIKAGRRHR